MTSFLRRLRLGFSKGPRERQAGGAQCRYVAIIMDGNGRWASGRHLPAAVGHRAGAKALRNVVERALDREIAELTVYSFSTENWSRSHDEVRALMDLFLEQVATEVPEVQQRGARVLFLGRREGLEPRIGEAMERAERDNPPDARMTLYIAFNYGSRAEILDAARALLAELRARDRARADADSSGAHASEPGSVPGSEPVSAREPEPLDEALFRRYLYAPEMHDPDLLIRTSGEERLSNFLLWQVAYAELLFVSTLWPDFTPDDFDEALAVYARRQRRFGGR